MYNRNHQLNVAHTLTTYFLLCYFHTATVAHNTFITNALVLSAGTLVILNRTKNAFAEQTITLGFVSTVVNSFRFQYFTIATFQNGIRRSQTDSNLGKRGSRTIIFFN